MKIAIMQPYFMPYIGYFQLIKAVDVFVIYDNIKYTKKGWINRNRYLLNGRDSIFSIPLKKDSDFLDVRERFISGEFDKKKLLLQIKEAYRKAPFFEETYSVFSRIVQNEKQNLFDFIFFSVKETCSYLGINTKIVVSSELDIDHNLKSQEKVIAICKKLGAQNYINAIGGQELYSKKAFNDEGIQLNFIKALPIIYKQFDDDFVPWLSILDVMMFNSNFSIRDFINDFSIVEPISQ